ncbi:MAG: response regulator [bacterium]
MSKKRALIVEDDPQTREIMAKVLESLDMQVLEAETAESGWKALELNEPSLALVDLMLPGETDGIELVRKIKESDRFKKTKIIVITGVEKKKPVDAAVAAGADMVVSKPFLPKELAQRIREAMHPPEKRSGGFRVLVMDDDENDGELARNVLEKRDYQVLLLNTAAGALPEIKNFGPDLILLDVMMPEIAGQDLVPIIMKHRALTVKPKILYYSNLSADKLRQLVRDTGVQGYVCKVDGPGALLSAVESALQED